MAFEKNVLVITALASALLFSGCTVKENKVQEKQAPAQMTKVFSKADPQTCAEVSCITIQKDSLGKIFLLIASGKTGGSTPQWYDLKPQVVSFERSGDRIAILGQNYNSIYKEIQSVNLIQTFSIVSEDDKTITFNWGRGLRSFIAQNAYDTDGPSGDLTESSYTSIPVVDSFVRNIKFDDKNIELEQVSKVPSSNIKQGSDKNALTVENREETLVMNVQIRSYNLDSAFKPKAYDATRRVGFFVNKVKQDGYSNNVVNLISHWDLNPERGPIKIRISATVPADYVQSVIEGAQYWNIVFGRNVIEIETGVKPEDASPQDRSIMIRWIDWLDAGAAYAISQSDPLTGEILRGQVFLPSVFTKVGSADLTDLNGKAPVIVNGAIACDVTKNLKELAKIAREASSSQRLRLAQDSVRSTVAHELGHAFGLRHNFAGSYSAKVSVDDINNAAKTYLKDLKHPGLETSTSIMDYVSGIDNILMSARIKVAALSYDKMAMTWAYADGDAALDDSISKYCTDEDIALANSQGLNIYGCERFDNGNNPLQRKFLDAKDEKGNLVNVLFASIIGRMYPGDQPDVVVNLDQVLKDTLKWAKADLSPLGFVGQVLFDSTKDGTPAGSFASLDYVKGGKVLYAKFGQDQVFQATRQKDLAAIGGYVGILNGLLRDSGGNIEMNWFDKEVDALVASGYLDHGKTLSGRDYQLTTEQQNKIIAFYRAIAKYNKKIVYTNISALLPKINEDVQADDGTTSKVTSVLAYGLVDQAQGEALGQLSLDLMSASDSQVTGKVNGVSVTLPARFLTVEERTMMLKLLSTQGLSFSQEVNKAKVKAALMTSVNSILAPLNIDVSVLTADQRTNATADLLNKGLIDASAKTWLDSEIAIINVLDAVK